MYITYSDEFLYRIKVYGDRKRFKHYKSSKKIKL